MYIDKINWASINVSRHLLLKNNTQNFIFLNFIIFFFSFLDSHPDHSQKLMGSQLGQDLYSDFIQEGPSSCIALSC